MNKHLTTKILKSFSRAFALVGLVMVISAVSFTIPAALAQSTGPSWNTGSTANEQNWFQVSNATQGGAWADSITGIKAGDVINFKIYMHNNTCPANDGSGNNHDNCPNNVAHNAYVHATLPANGGTVTATIGSDESGANISRSTALTLPAGQTITYKVGSTRIIHNQFDTTTFWPIPNTAVTENAADNVTSGNLDQGDIVGCYSWSRFITFQAVVSSGSVKGATTLPKTGPEQGVELLLLGMIPAGVLLRRVRI